MERQVGEAIRLEMRKNCLNYIGEFNRCTLTRLTVDREWDQKVHSEQVRLSIEKVQEANTLGRLGGRGNRLEL